MIPSQSYRAPSTVYREQLPTLGPKVCRYVLLWAIWSAKVDFKAPRPSQKSPESLGANNIKLYDVKLYILNYTIGYYIILDYIPLYYTIRYSAILHYITSYYTRLCYTVIYYTKKMYPKQVGSGSGRQPRVREHELPLRLPGRSRPQAPLNPNELTEGPGIWKFL